MNDTAARALRTFAQGFIGVLAIVAIPVLNDIVSSVGSGGEVTIDVDLWRGIAIAAVAGGLIALVSWAQNRLEDVTGHDLVASRGREDAGDTREAA